MASAVSLVKGTVGQAAPLGFLTQAVQLGVGEDMPDIIVGAGAADGDAQPFLGANKGSLYLRTDASDDATHVFQKLDEAGDDNDWVGMNTFTGTLAATLTIGVNDTGYDVKFFGATAGSYWLWDESADGVVLVGSHTQTGNTQLTGTLTVGVNDTGHDVKFFGATAGSYWLWDESGDGVVMVGSHTQTGNTQLTGTLTVGVNDTGHDVKFFGATAGAYMLWDESGDELIFATGASIDLTAAKVMIDFQDGDASTIVPSETAENGWINVNVGGVKKYIPYYAAS